MGVTSLTKQKGGAALVQNFKDIFPGQIEKMYIYRGTNLLSKGENVIAREDHQTTISLQLIKTVEVIYGGEALTSVPRTIQEEKQNKELTRDIVNSESVTAFIKDLGDIDLNDDALYYAIGTKLILTEQKQDQLKVLTFNNVVPNLLKKLVTGTTSLSNQQNNIIKNNRSISFNFSPAILDDTLVASKMIFVDGEFYKPLPVDEIDFEITSIDIEADHTLMLEYKNGIKARGVIESGTNNDIETDIPLKMDKAILPINVNPYGKKGNLEFAIGNFNKFIYMPWLYANKFLGANKDISGYISQGSNEQWVKDLIKAVVDMFKLSHAISTGFREYRDGSGDVKDEQLGGISLKALEGKRGEELIQAVDGVMKNWEYANPIRTKSEEFVRARQVLAASSQWISSSYCIAKGLTEFHKSILDFYLDLESDIKKDTVTINMSLNSLRYDFTYEKDDDGNDDLSKPIINLKPILDISKIEIDETDRYVSLPEIDDPISTSTFVTFAGDIDSTRQDSLKYKVGVDITEPDAISRFFINQENSNEKIETITGTVDTGWFITDIAEAEGSLSNGKDVPVKFAFTIPFKGRNVYDKYLLGQSPNNFLKEYLQLPISAYDVTIKNTGKRIVETFDENDNNNDRPVANAPGSSYPKGDIVGDINWKYTGLSTARVVGGRVEAERYEGLVYEYKIKTTTHGASDKVLTYTKSTYWNMISSFSNQDSFKRRLTISDDFRDDKGNQIVKIKSIDRIYLSFILGNYVDIKINYKYTDQDGKEITGSELLPRIELPSKTDETRTKLGISL